MRSIEKIKEKLGITNWVWADKESQHQFMKKTESWALLIGFFTDKKGKRGYIEKNPLSSSWDSRYIRIHYCDCNCDSSDCSNCNRWSCEGPSLKDLGIELENPLYAEVLQRLPSEQGAFNSSCKTAEDSEILSWLYGRLDFYEIDEPDAQKAKVISEIISEVEKLTSENIIAQSVRLWGLGLEGE